MSTGMLRQKVKESVRNKKYFIFLFTFFGTCDIMYIGRNNMEQLTEKNILYDPRSDRYKIKAGDKITEIPGSSLQSEGVRVLDELLHGTDDDAYRKIYLGDWLDKDKKTEDPISLHTFDTIGGAVFRSVLRPECPTITVYSDKKTAKGQPDSHPSIPYRAIIEDAIELLNKNKKLRLHKISLNRFKTDYILTVSSRGHTALGKTPVRTLEILINLATFDRARKMEQDKDAGLGEELDTNTYIKLRIAFLLYKALGMTDEDAKKFSIADNFRVMLSNTQFDYSV